jgi:RHS repeat-associated protein
MNYTYSFYLRDHLGNNRMVVNASKTVKEVNHYYPYGGLFGENAGSDVQPYKYNFSIERGKSKLAYSSEREKNRPKVNGKELDRMNGLDWYDYGARHMDGALARFTTMDPLCEKYYGISPYAYCAGNPVNLVDPDGSKIVFVNGKIGFGSPPPGEQYWGGVNSSFVQGATEYYQDFNTYFTSVDYGKFSSAYARMLDGYEFAKNNI